MRFCSKCGNEVNAGAKFCASCGQAIPCENMQGSCSAPIVDIEKRAHMRALMWWVWLAFAFSIIETIGVCFDVQQYYSCGRPWAVLLGIIGVMIELWLVIGLEKHLSWARKSYVVYNFLSVVGVLVISLSDTSDVMNYGSVIIGVGCALWMLRKDVRTVCCRRDTHFQALLWWMSFCLLSGCYYYAGLEHEGSEEWYEDCIEAAECGSSDARNKLVEVVADRLRSEDDSLSEEESVESATKFIDECLEEASCLKEASSSIEQCSEGKNKKTFKQIVIALCGLIFVSLKSIFKHKR